MTETTNGIEHNIPKGNAAGDDAAKNQIDSPEKNESVLGLLQDPALGLQSYLKGKTSLSPQKVAEVWGSGSTYSALQEFGAQKSPEAKSEFLSKTPALQNAVEQTKSILESQEQTKSAEEKSDQEAGDPDAMLANAFNDQPKESSPEEKPDTFGATELLQAIGRGDLLTQDPELAKELKNNPKLKAIAEKLAKVPPEKRDAYLKANQAKLNQLVDPLVKDAENEKKDAESQDGKEQEKSEQEKAIQELKEAINKPTMTLAEINALLAKFNSVNLGEIKDKGSLDNLSIAKANLEDVQRQLSAIPGMGATPQEQAVLNQMLPSLNVAWKAPQASVKYGNVISALQSRVTNDGSGLSSETVGNIAQSLGVKYNNHSVNSGGDIDKGLREGRGTETVTRYERKKNPETGEWETVKVQEEVPLEYDKEHPLEVRPGVVAYTGDNGAKMMQVRTKNRMVETDVTGWRIDKINNLAESMAYFSITEDAGVTSIAEEAVKIDFSVFNSNFDDDVLEQNSRIITAQLGGLEGGDGDIFKTSEAKGLLISQLRLFAPGGAAMGDGSALGAEDREFTQKRLQALGLMRDGKINDDVFREFGSITQSAYLTGSLTFESVQEALHGKFPDLVEKPGSQD